MSTIANTSNLTNLELEKAESLAISPVESSPTTEPDALKTVQIETIFVLEEEAFKRLAEKSTSSPAKT
jgi:hypothetical protein